MHDTSLPAVITVVSCRTVNAPNGRDHTRTIARGSRQSFFLQQMIESGIAAIEVTCTWLPADVLSQVRSGLMPPRQAASRVISDLFEGH